MSPHAVQHARNVLNRLSAIPTGSGAPALERFPDFLIVGPQRTGTTWLHYHLQSHPDIFLPNEKETYFFSALRQPELRNYKYETLCDYLDIAMRDRPGRWVRKQLRCLMRCGSIYRPIVLGDATATYAILPKEVIDEIVLLNPAIKVILMLRDPVERAWSHARKDLLWRSGRLASEVPLDEFKIFFRGSGQIRLARYSELIEVWRRHLQDGHLFVGLFDDIAEQPMVLLERMQEFLGVRSGARFMDSGKLKSRINPAPEAEPPPGVRDIIIGQLGNAVAEYERLAEQVARERDAWKSERGGV